MPNLEDIAESLTAKKRQQIRRLRLLELINQVLSGQLSTGQQPIDNLFQTNVSSRDALQDGSRPHYISPKDRSTYNSGYMEISELGAGTPNIW